MSKTQNPRDFPTSFRFSEKTRLLLKVLSDEESLTQTALIETLVAQRARTLGIKIRDSKTFERKSENGHE